MTNLGVIIILKWKGDADSDSSESDVIIDEGNDDSDFKIIMMMMGGIICLLFCTDETVPSFCLRYWNWVLQSTHSTQGTCNS